MTRAEKWTVWCLAGCLVASYVYVLCGPLKMAGDSPGYVELAAFIRHGTPATAIAIPGYPYYFPRGYPYLLIGLNALGLTNGPSIIAINLAALAVALWLSFRLLVNRLGLSEFAASLIAVMTGAAACVFQAACCPVPEMVFFAISLASIYCLEISRDKPNAWPALIAAWALVAVSIFVRKAGIALVPAAILAVVLQPGVKQFLTPARRALLAIVAGGLCCLLLVLFGADKYMTTIIPDRIGRLRGVWADALYFKVLQFGELATSLRAAHFPPNYRGEFELLGVIVLAVCAVGLWSRRGRFGLIDVYLVSYFLLVAAYPFWQQRLWAPILPFLFGLACLGVRQLSALRANWKTIARRAGIAYVVAFVLFGCLEGMRFSSSKIYDEVDDGFLSNREAQPYLEALRGPR